MLNGRLTAAVAASMAVATAGTAGRVAAVATAAGTAAGKRPDILSETIKNRMKLKATRPLYLLQLQCEEKIV